MLLEGRHVQGCPLVHDSKSCLNNEQQGKFHLTSRRVFSFFIRLVVQSSERVFCKQHPGRASLPDCTSIRLVNQAFLLSERFPEAIDRGALGKRALSRSSWPLMTWASANEIVKTAARIARKRISRTSLTICLRNVKKRVQCDRDRAPATARPNPLLWSDFTNTLCYSEERTFWRKCL